MDIETFYQLGQGFHDGKNQKIADRLNALTKLRKLIVDHEQDIFKAAKADFGRPAIEVMASELIMLCKEIDYVVNNLARWAKPQKVYSGLWGKGYLYPEPYGVVLIIAPWNFPFLLSLLPLIHAIAAGNCALIKPSELAPAQAAVIDRIVQESFDPAIATVVQGDAQVGKELLSLPFDYIFFTGSCIVGKIVYQEAAKHLIPVTLELGGKNPTIVTRNTNIDHTAQKIVWGKFLNAGQCCLAPDYVLVDEAIKESFLHALKKYILLFYGSDAAKSPDYARIVNQHHVERLSALLHDGTAVIGGQVDAAQRFIAPTVLINVKLQSKLMEEEIFGPILPIIPYKTLEEAISFIQQKPKPLAVYLFSLCNKTQEQIVRELSAGSCCINNVLIQHHIQALPFGGIGQSGMGAYHGKYGFETFSHCKTIFKSRSWFTRFWLKLPYRPWYLKIMRWWYR